MRVISSLETDALYHSFVDEDAAGDIAFFLYAVIAYCAVRVATELMLPGKIRGYTRQQVREGRRVRRARYGSGTRGGSGLGT